MTVKTKASVKSFFETGDRPTQAEFEHLIDSYQDQSDALDAIASAATSGRQGFVKLTSSSGASIVASNVITPEEHGAAGNGTTDDSDAVSAAVAAITTGATIAFPNEYLVTRAMPAVTKSCSVRGPGWIKLGATLSGNPILTFRSPLESPVSVQSINYSDGFDFGQGANTEVASLVYASAPYTAGDIIKIASNDQVTGSISGEQRGEFAYVGAVSGNTVYLTSKLRETYSTSARTISIDKDIRVDIDGLKFTSDYATGDAAGWSAEYLQVQGLFAPHVNVYVENGYDIGVHCFGCVEADINVRGKRFKNAADSEGIPGYIVQDSVGENCLFNIIGVDGRVCYTTNGFSSPNSVLKRGRTYGSVVRGAAFGMAANGFSTHPDGENISFINCVVSNTRMGESSSGGGFQLRGQNNRCLNCSVYGSREGFSVYKQESDDAKRNQLINCAAYYPELRAVNVSPASANGVLTSAATPYIKDFFVVGHVSAQEIVRCENARVDIDGFRVVWAPSIAGSYIFGCTSAADYRVDNLDARFEDATTGTIRLFNVGGSGCSIYLNDADIRTGSNGWSAVVQGGSKPDLTAYFKNVRADTAPSNADGTTQMHANATWAGEILVDDGRTSSTNFKSVEVSASGTTLTPSNMIGQILTIECTANNSAAEVSEIADGVLIPQILCVRNADASVNNLKIQDGNQIVLKSGSTLTLEPGEGAIFTWDGTNWHGLVGEQ